MSPFLETWGKLSSVIVALIGGWWAIEKWRKRDEHFPRINFEVTANFLGIQDGQMVVEVVAILENKGVVPLKIKDFTFKMRGISSEDPLKKGNESVREQLLFTRELAKGPFIPEKWIYSFVYPQVKTNYNYVTSIPMNISFIRVQADFAYILKGETHHAATICKVPDGLTLHKVSTTEPK